MKRSLISMQLLKSWERTSEKCKCGADDICTNKHTQSMTLVEADDDTSDDAQDNHNW